MVGSLDLVVVVVQQVVVPDLQVEVLLGMFQLLVTVCWRGGFRKSSYFETTFAFFWSV